MKLSNLSFLAAVALLLAAAPSAHAQVAAGTEVVNTATVSYTVDNVPQTTEPTGSATFTVDRLVSLAVTESGDSVTSVVPGATNQALLFTVTNSSNDFLDIALAATDAANGTNFVGGSGAVSPAEVDNQDTGATFTLYLDVGASPGVLDGGDTVLPTSGGTHYVDGLAPSSTVNVLVVADQLPDDATLSSNDVMVVRLVGTAHSAYANQRVPTPTEITDRNTALLTPGTPYANGALGVILADNSGSADVSAEIDNVFADAADTTEGTGDPANDGKDSSFDAFKVRVTSINVAKTYGIVDGGAGNTTNPKAIPGATLVYCIAVSNAGDTDATDVTITDNIPAGTTYVANSLRIDDAVVDCGADPAAAILAGDAKTDAVDADEGDAGPGAAGPITTVVDVDATEATTTIFQVTID